MAFKGYLQLDKFPQCCGATIFSGFGKTNNIEEPSSLDDPTISNIEKFLNTNIVLGGREDIHNWHDMSRNAFHMAILNEYQKYWLHAVFIKAHFELVMSNYNPHSGIYNHLYVRKVDHS